MSKVRIPPMLREEVGGAREVPAEGENVRELLDDLMGQFPALRAQLVRDDEIAPFVNVYLEGEDVRTLDGLDTPVAARPDRHPATGDGRRADVRVQELYEHWAADPPYDPEDSARASTRAARTGCSSCSRRSGRSRATSSSTSARATAKHFRRLVEAHGLRGLATRPRPERRRTSSKASIEELPLEDESVDWIWARDMLVHVDLEPAFAECVRVLKPGGRMVAYVTLATDELEPRERAWLCDAIAIRNFDGARVEAAAAGADARAEDRARQRVARADDRGRRRGTRPTRSSGLARMRRLGDRRARSTAPDLSWGIYQLLGKTCPTVYVWSKTSSA